MATMEHTEPGYMIAGTFYPMPKKFRLGDPVLVSELTGLEWTEFSEALNDERLGASPVVQIGLVGVAVWQARPTWKRRRVVDFVEAIPEDAVTFEPGVSTDDPDDPPDGSIPNAEAGQAGNLPDSPATSTPPAADSQEPSSPTTTGEPGSATTSPA